ncbi:MAG TPA: UvrD-helicase domain-containing protein [Gammaproteobacteria bacterium]
MPWHLYPSLALSAFKFGQHTPMRQTPPTSAKKAAGAALNHAEAAAPDINAAVSASAGTGKTYLLVTRIIRLLLEGAKPENILALTFTRKAAGEMRQRLLARLQHFAMLDDSPLDHALLSINVESSASKRASARNLYEQVLFAEKPLRISTFHAFCQDLLRRFPLEAGVPAGYELLEKTGTLEAMAWDALFLKATRNPDTALATALETLFDLCNGLTGTRNALLRGFLNHRSDWWSFTENQPNPATYAREYIRAFLQPADDPCKDFFSSSRQAALIEFRELLLRHPIDSNLAYASDLEQGLNPNLDPAKRFALIVGAFLTNKLEPRKRTYSKTLEKKLGGETAGRFVQLHEQLCETVLETHDACLRKTAYELNAAWYAAGQSLLDHYQTLKQEQRLLDFADLEWKSYCLLRDPEHSLWVQYKLDQKIDHILIDEFQDTNPTQWQLILPILQEIAGGNEERSRSIFLVGDTKQSIYSFRRANPRLQAAATEWLKTRLNGRLFPLSKSWRSSPVIMHCLNAIFGGNTSLGNLLDDYADHDTHCQHLWGRVEMLPLAAPEAENQDRPPLKSGLRDPLTEPPQQTEISTHYLEGLQIANRIQELITERVIVEKDGEQLPLDLHDMYILLRNRTHAAEYEQALQDCNIPYIGLERGGLLDSLEVQDLEALLNVLVTPFNNLALAQVLKSPLFSANDGDLIQLAGCDESTHWYERLTSLVAKGQASPSLCRASRLLSEWRNRVGYLPVHDLLDRIYHEGDVLNRYRQATPNVLQGRVSANLNLLLEMALEMDSGRYPSLMRFLYSLKQLRNHIPDQPDSPPPSEQQAKVRLMTIHAAKGLEAPVVFLADAATTGKPSESYHVRVDWPAAHSKPAHMLLAGNKASLPRRMQELRERLHTLQDREQANLLYVALTRARQILIISGSASRRRSEAQSGWYQQISEALAPLLIEDRDGRRHIQTGSIPAASRHSSNEHAVDIQSPGEYLFQASATPTHSVKPSTAVSSVQKPSHSFEEHAEASARKRGVIIHKLLELMSPPAPRPNPRFEDFLGYGVNREQLNAWQQEVIGVLQSKELRFLFDPGRYLTAYNEIPIAYTNNDNRLVYGIIDRVVILENAVWIIDYKTQTGIGESLLPEFIRYYEPQLNYYAEGAKKLWPERSIHTALLLTGTARLLPVSTI